MIDVHAHLDLLQRFDAGLAVRLLLDRHVRPGMRVLDAGTGTGVVALWAAQLGAEVVAVDESDTSRAETLAAANGLSDKVSFRTASLDSLAETDLGGRFDVITATAYFNDPRRDEARCSVVAGVVERLLAPGGIAIPDRIAYRASLCAWHDQDVTSKQRTLRARSRELEGRYGLRFDPLIDEALATPNTDWYPPRRADGTIERPGARFLSEQVLFCEVNYLSGAVAYPPTLTIRVEIDGMASSILWSQELLQGDTLVFRTESVSWLSQPKRVARGERLILSIDDTWRASNVLSAGNR